jgi:hypothetical protein
MEKENGNYVSGHNVWNYCAYVSINANNSASNLDTFAYVLEDNGHILTMTDDTFITTDATSFLYGATNATAVSYEMSADTKCANGTTGFESTVVCDASNTAQGSGKIVSASYSDCTLKVVVSHASGCPLIDLSGISTFLAAAKWVVGICFIISGPFIGMFGK